MRTKGRFSRLDNPNRKNPLEERLEESEGGSEFYTDIPQEEPVEIPRAPTDRDPKPADEA